MKVTLVYPRFNRASFGSGSIHMPLGVVYLATYLRDHDIKVNVVDCTFFKKEDEYFDKMKKLAPDVIGFSFSSPLADTAFHTIKQTRKMFPYALIICGGPHPSVDPETTIQREGIDVVVIGEAEDPFLEICKTYGDGSRDFSSIGRVFYKNSIGKVCRSNLARPFIQNLDSLSLPDRNFLDVPKYIQATGRITIITSRGCSGRCTFCQPAVQTLFGGKIRAHQPEYIIQDTLQIRNQYYKNNFLIEIVDDTFSFNKKRTMALCDLMIHKGLQTIPWWCITRIDFLDEEIIASLKNAGCMGVSLGVESGSDRILKKVMQKNITTAQIKDV